MRGSRLVALLVVVATVGAFAMALTMKHQAQARKRAAHPAASTPSAPATRASAAAAVDSFTAQRRALHTQIRIKPQTRLPAPPPPRALFEAVTYPAPLGANVAYVTPPARDGKKRPAIVWIHGGFDWSIDDWLWGDTDYENEQTARAFRQAGMVEMFPSLRGCNENPGDKEYFLGEVDDVLAAIDFVKKRPDVDATRVYLGGHSTGGTLALLVAASRPAVRAVFAFGPVANVTDYGKYLPPVLAESRSPEEIGLRSPLAWMDQIDVPVYVIEGEQGNADSLEELKHAGKPPAQFLLVRGASHFTLLAPATELIAARLMADANGGARFALSEQDLVDAVAKHASAQPSRSP